MKWALLRLGLFHGAGMAEEGIHRNIVDPRVVRGLRTDGESLPPRRREAKKFFELRELVEKITGMQYIVAVFVAQRGGLLSS